MSATLTSPPAAQERRLRSATTVSPPATERDLHAAGTGPDIVEIWGRDSFPASDAPANW